MTSHGTSDGALTRSLSDAATLLQWLQQFEAREGVIAATGDTLAECLQRGGRILSCGNGGSMCDAMHFAQELSGHFRAKRRALIVASVPELTNRTFWMDGTRRQTVSASLTSLSVGAPKVVPLFATCLRQRKMFPFACPKINGPQDPTKSMYCFASASIIYDPLPQRINFGAPPTASHARTGLLTPPGIFSRARR